MKLTKFTPKKTKFGSKIEHKGITHEEAYGKLVDILGESDSWFVRRDDKFRGRHSRGRGEQTPTYHDYRMRIYTNCPEVATVLALLNDDTPNFMKNK